MGTRPSTDRRFKKMRAGKQQPKAAAVEHRKCGPTADTSGKS